MMKTQDTFTLWGVQDIDSGQVFVVRQSREQARKSNWNNRVVKLECRIIPQKKPRKPKTFTAHGLTWIPHTPGDPMPCDGERKVRILWRKEKDGDSYQRAINPAKEYEWEASDARAHKVYETVGWNYADAK
jgi:hypothetical protein